MIVLLVLVLLLLPLPVHLLLLQRVVLLPVATSPREEGLVTVAEEQQDRFRPVLLPHRDRLPLLPLPLELELEQGLLPQQRCLQKYHQCSPLLQKNQTEDDAVAVAHDAVRTKSLRHYTNE